MAAAGVPMRTLREWMGHRGGSLFSEPGTATRHTVTARSKEGSAGGKAWDQTHLRSGAGSDRSGGAETQRVPKSDEMESRE